MPQYVWNTERTAGWDGSRRKRGSVQICSGCACSEWRLHVVVPSLQMGTSPTRRCPLSRLKQPSLHPALDFIFYFKSQSQKLFRKYCIIPWLCERLQAKGVCLDRACFTPEKSPKLLPSWCGGILSAPLWCVPNIMPRECNSRGLCGGPLLCFACVVCSRICWLEGLSKRHGITSVPAQMSARGLLLL